MKFFNGAFSYSEIMEMPIPELNHMIEAQKDLDKRQREQKKRQEDQLTLDLPKLK